MTKKLITIMWSASLEVEVPDDTNLDDLGFCGKYENVGNSIIEAAANNLSWKSGEITSVDEIPDDLPPENFDHDPRFDEGGEFYEEAKIK